MTLPQAHARFYPCAYCSARADNWDHVVPRSIQKRHPMMPVELTYTVPACFACNARKSTRRLIPASWADRLDALNDYFGGAPWRVWNGDPTDEAYRAVWK